MQGYLVERKAGWDCHGLPVELAVEKELGFSGKDDIEAYGVAEFNARCRESVLRHVDAFEEMTERMGYWVDTSDPYRTMDPAYVESVWWALKQIHDKGLLVEDYRVAPYCPRCGTGLSDHELAQGYETVTDPQRLRPVPAHLRPVRRPGRRCSSGPPRRGRWCPTPPSPSARTSTYVVATDGTETLVVAEPLFERGARRGLDRAGHGAPARTWSAGPTSGPFELVEFPPRAGGTAPHLVVLADYVTTEDGTGLVHQSPAFGEDDMAVCRAYGLPVVVPGAARTATSATTSRWSAASSSSTPTPTWSRTSRRAGCCSGTSPTSTATRTAGAATRALCTTPSRPGTSGPPQVKDALLRENEKTSWFPETIKWGRYGDWLNNNIDWALSRSRYWGTPLPIWRCAEGHQTCVGSLAELSELTGTDQSELDPHRPYVDDVDLRLPASAARRRTRVPEVIDAWFDSGSMPFAQWGYPHAPGSASAFEQAYPARLHLRGDRPDPRLVLHADGDRHAGLRRVVVQERAVPGPHPGRGRPQDVQAPRQHPRADAADGPARRGRGALVHGRLRLAVGGPPGRARDASRRPSARCC